MTVIDRTLEIPSAAEGLVSITNYGDIAVVLRHRDTVVYRGNPPALSRQALHTLDGEEHFERRRLESQLFKAARLAHYERDTLTPLLDELFDGLRAQRDSDGVVEVDLVRFGLSALSRIATLFTGIDGADTDEAITDMLQCMDGVYKANNLHWSKSSDDEKRVVLARGLELDAHFSDRFIEPSVERRRALLERHRSGELTDADLPVDLVMLLLVHPRDDWGPELLLRETTLFLGASIRTSVRQLCNALDELFGWFEIHPEHVGKVDDTEFLHHAIEETLRLHPAVPMLMRQATADIPLPSGAVLHEGERAALLYAFANRV